MPSGNEVSDQKEHAHSENEERNNQPDNSSTDEATYWRNMFEALRRERVTNAEKQLEATLQENIRRDEALRTMVKHLEKEKQRYQQRSEMYEKQLKEMKDEKENVGASMNKNTPIASDIHKRKKLENDVDKRHISQLTEQVKQQAQLLEVYEILTGTKICEASSKGNDGASYNCTVINHDEKIASQFRLSFVPSNKASSVVGEMRCEPIANAQFLPDFMQDPEPIVFERTQCAVLLKNVLMSMFKEEDTDDVQDQVEVNQLGGE